MARRLGRQARRGGAPALPSLSGASGGLHRASVSIPSALETPAVSDKPSKKLAPHRPSVRRRSCRQRIDHGTADVEHQKPARSLSVAVTRFSLSLPLPDITRNRRRRYSAPCVGTQISSVRQNCMAHCELNAHQLRRAGGRGHVRRRMQRLTYIRTQLPSPLQGVVDVGLVMTERETALPGVHRGASDASSGLLWPHARSKANISS